ncbi:MAG: iron-containing alcohol dehydrogenase [Planctomycetes bacterium]|nr:iron-containing alcohol dehydrogenase [Planctomycetota bacterium]
MSTVRLFQCPRRTLIGVGAAERLPDEVKRLGARRPAIITDPGVAASPGFRIVTEALEKAGLSCPVFSGVIPEPPFEVLDESTPFARQAQADLLIGLGGGSSMDVAKMTALLLANAGDPRSFYGTDKVPKPGIPTILMPTTAGTGSEVTNIAIFKDRKEKLKKGIVTDFNYCQTAILDPRLTASMPPDVTAATGLDALVHAIECYISVNATDMTDTFALRSVTVASRYLRRAVRHGDDMEAREKLQVACLMSALAFGNAGVCGVHALSYPLGGRHDVPHGVANALMMVPVLRFNRKACPGRYRDLAMAWGLDVTGLTTEQAVERFLAALAQLTQDVGVPLRLREVGVTEDALPAMADAAITVTRLLANNPCPIPREDALRIYCEAF